MRKKTISYAFYKTLPIMTGYIVLGTGFGILLETKGYGLGWSLLMSVSIYAGSMQYVAIDLLSGGASLLASALMTLMVNARHLFYGVSMIERYRDLGKTKPYLIFSLTDETYSLVCGRDVPEIIDEKKYYFYVSLMNQCYWVLGSVIGSAIGSLLTFNTAGIDFSMTALFLVVFIEQWRSNTSHISAWIGLGASLVCLIFFGADRFIIPSMILITILLTVSRRFLEAEEQEAA